MNKVPYTYANKGSKSMENSIIHSLTSISWQGAFLVFLIENVVIFILVIVIGNLITSRFSLRPVCLPPPALTPAEISVWLINVCLNTLITLAGWHLWKNGIIQFRDGINLRSLIDVIVLLLVMDGLMYALHRLAHISFLFPYIHRYHHRFERPRPGTLFSLNPVENIGFGALWLFVIAVYSTSWFGMSAYLFLNVAFGTIGHLGVEPLPKSWARIPVINYIAGSSFHAQHHRDMNHNFGFYSIVWDRLFGTLRKGYHKQFGKIPYDEI
ncbi:sterol desaturase family protein [Leptospira alstonii]|uniref:Fatty acid hydroxylase family protein n=3 Tax=Leptospira alstonii TaxID=28452 RepID=M6D3M7_9LEPT|nr:sterol desaturase family protein [Leptospira alstonii]EMJ93155.1 fatty acid hydroxylase family protein [Leptospira alstonii serovar Sichuan str. 79601]EQA78405.1 fatty acid hydroxylase family protein [Leptospira alstonii serovar Pingchang str. 80-412]